MFVPIHATMLPSSTPPPSPCFSVCSVVKCLSARACLAGAWLVLLAWLVGMVVNDRVLWSQFLWWIPTPVAAGASALLLACAWGVERVSHTPKQLAGNENRNSTRRWRTIVNTTWCAIACVVLSLVVFEMRAYRVLLPRPAPPTQPLRLLNWNINTARIQDVPARVAPLSPDVFLMANRPYFGLFSDLRKTVAEHTSVAAGGRLAVISKYPVIAYAHFSLGVSGAKPRTHRWDGGGMVSVDKGEALLVLLDTKAWNGGTTCIWFLDLPSDPPIPRARVMREARSAIENFAGPHYLPRENAADQPVPADPLVRAQPS